MSFARIVVPHDAITAGNSENGYFSSSKLAVAVPTFLRRKLAAEKRVQKIPVPARRFQETTFDAICFLSDEAARHRVDYAFVGEHFAVLGNAPFRFNLFGCC